MQLALNIPGRKNSGPQHWQTSWERELNWLHRVEMPEWEFAEKQAWVGTLEQEILKAPQKVYLVSHSLGGLTIAHLADSARERVLGAFIVAPPDISSYDPPPIVQTFQPVPLKPFPFPSVVVASSNDPYCSIEVSEQRATAWGSSFINIGEAGHIGSDLNGWPEGLQKFLDFVRCTGVSEN